MPKSTLICSSIRKEWVKSKVNGPFGLNKTVTKSGGHILNLAAQNAKMDTPEMKKWTVQRAITGWSNVMYE